MTGDLHFKPAYELAAMIRRRELKPSELMAATIARIEETNPKLNALDILGEFGRGELSYLEFHIAPRHLR